LWYMHEELSGTKQWDLTDKTGAWSGYSGMH